MSEPKRRRRRAEPAKEPEVKKANKVPMERANARYPVAAIECQRELAKVANRSDSDTLRAVFYIGLNNLLTMADNAKIDISAVIDKANDDIKKLNKAS